MTSGEGFGRFPETTGELWIAAVLARRDLLAALEIRTGDIRQFWRRCRPRHTARCLRRRDHERHEQGADGLVHGGERLADVRASYEAGVDAIGGDATALKAASELVGEQHQRQL